MNMKRSLVIIGIVIIAVFIVFFYRYQHKTLKLAPDPMATLINNKINYLAQKYEASEISVGITNKGKTQYFNQGMTHTFPPLSINYQSSFEIASITKTFTALLTAYLDQTDQLELLAPIKKYWPQTNDLPSGKKITLQKLLTHTTQLPRFAPQSSSSTEIIKFVANWNPKTQPKPQVRYSNLGFAVAGHVVEKAISKQFPNLVQQLIFNPLNFSCTIFKSPVNDIDQFYLPSDGLKSCAQDMVQYMQAMMDEKEISSEMTKAIQQTLKGYYQTPYYYQGLAWELYPLPVTFDQLSHVTDKALNATELKTPREFEGNMMVVKTGTSDNGNSSIIAFVPKHHIGIVLLSNKDIPANEKAQFIYDILETMMKE